VADLAIEEKTGNTYALGKLKKLYLNGLGKKKKDVDTDLTTKVKYMKELFQFAWKRKQKKMSRYHGLGISIR